MFRTVLTLWLTIVAAVLVVIFVPYGFLILLGLFVLIIAVLLAFAVSIWLNRDRMP